MAHLGRRSLEVYDTLHPDIQRVICKAIKRVDFSLIEGHRAEGVQAARYAIGRTVDLHLKPVTRAKPGESKHERWPSDAVDLIPCPFKGWDDKAGFAHVAGVMLEEAAKLDVPMVWGNDWDGDGVVVADDPDESLVDMPHLERVVS